MFYNNTENDKEYFNIFNGVSMSTKVEQRNLSNERIINATIDEISKKGYFGAKLTQIAKKAQVSGGLITLRFDSKENLIKEISKESVNKFANQFDAIEYNDPKIIFKKYVDYLLELAKKDRKKFNYWLTMLQTKDLPNSFFEPFIEKFNGSILSKYIELEQKNGNIIKDITPFEVLKLFATSVFTTINYHLNMNIPFENNAWYLNSIYLTKNNFSNVNKSNNNPDNEGNDYYLSYLARDYEVIFYIDTETNKYKYFYKDGSIIAPYLIVDDENFFDSLYRNLEKYIYVKDRKRVIEEISIDKIKEMLEKKIASIIKFRVFINGEIQYYQLKIAKIEKINNNFKFVMGIRSSNDQEIKDFSYQTKLQDEKELAEAQNNAKSEFLEKMSHDIRTPLSNVVGTIELAKKSIDDKEKMSEYLNKISDASTNLLYLIRDIFDMRKIERNEIEISHKSINIPDFAESCIAKYSSELELKNTKINIDCGSIEHPYVLGDEIHLRHVIRRVIELFMKNSKDNSTIILKINENSYINKIVFIDFQIFVDSIVSKKLNSTDNSSLYNDIYSNSYNYNLPYLKRLVELMGGSFIITNDEELGPKMIISMSFAVDEETVLLKEIESFDTKESLKGTKILLVDDDLIQLSNAQEILSDEGVSVTIAKNGEEAIQKFIASRFNQFDAILIDVDMALLSGFETAKRIRSINRVDAQDIPIIALFDEVSGDEFKNVQYSGMNAYITKPITIPELLKTLIKVASNRSIVLAEKLASAINLATKDALTNISNRTAYDTYEKNIQNKIDQGENLEFAILFCDMNNLKETNDTYGHEVGDQSLKTTSKIICDIFKHSPVFRIGGDEFVVIVQNEDYKDRDNLLNKLKEKIKQEPIISLACGMATYMKSDLTVKNVLDRADAYMYEDKKIIKGVNIRN